jgi:integration host factor subunit alpha
MTKSELIDIIAKKAHLPKKAAKEAVDVVFDEISRSLEKGDKVVISSFGTFYVNKVDDKLVVPFGEESEKQVVKSHRVVNFRVGKPLRKKVW